MILLSGLSVKKDLDQFGLRKLTHAQVLESADGWSGGQTFGRVVRRLVGWSDVWSVGKMLCIKPLSQFLSHLIETCYT